MRRAFMVGLLMASACTSEDLAGPVRPRLSPAIGMVDVMPAVTAGFGVDLDLEIVLGGPGPAYITPALSDPYKTQLLSVPAPVPILRNWFDNVVQPALGAAVDDLTLLAALSEFWEWYETGQNVVINGPFEKVLGVKLEPFYEGAALKLRLAIQGNLTLCREQQSFTALANVIYWHERAEELVVDTPLYGLDFESVTSDLQNLCAQVVLESAVLPDLLEVGTQYTLSEVFAIRFHGQEATVPAPFQVTLLAEGLLLGNPPNSVLEGSTTASGGFEASVVAPAEGTARIMSHPFLILPGRTLPTPYVGGVFELIRNVIEPTDPPPPPPPPLSGNLTGTWNVRIGIRCSFSDHFAGPVTFTSGAASFSFLADGQCQLGSRLSGTVTATLDADVPGEPVLTDIQVSDLSYTATAGAPACEEDDILIPGPVALVGGAFAATISHASICGSHTYWLVELTPTSPLF